MRSRPGIGKRPPSFCAEKPCSCRPTRRYFLAHGRQLRPALFLEVLAFWFVLRWLLVGRAVLFVGRVLVLMMIVGALATLDDRKLIWAACFVGAAFLAWALLRRWRGQGFRRPDLRIAAVGAWRGRSAAEVAALCERRIGLQVDAAVPATIAANPASRCVLALAGEGVWVLGDESRVRLAQVGRVLACWDRAGLVAHVEHSRRGERLELSWPRNGALVRGVMPPGAPADLFAGHLAADELRLNR